MVLSLYNDISYIYGVYSIDLITRSSVLEVRRYKKPVRNDGFFIAV